MSSVSSASSISSVSSVSSVSDILSDSSSLDASSTAPESKGKKRKRQQTKAPSKKRMEQENFCAQVMKNLKEGIFFGGWKSGVKHAVYRPSNAVHVLKKFPRVFGGRKSLSDLVAPEEKDEKMEEQKRSRRQRRLARSLRKKLASVAYKGMNRLTLAKDGISPLFASYQTNQGRGRQVE